MKYTHTHIIVLYKMYSPLSSPVCMS